MDLENIKKILNKHDPVGLLSMGAPESEYLPEAQSIQALLIKEKNFSADEIEEQLVLIFSHYFDKDVVNENITSYKKIATELRALVEDR